MEKLYGEFVRCIINNNNTKTRVNSSNNSTQFDLPGNPTKVIQFDKSFNNGLVFYCLNMFRFWIFIHRFRF